MLVSEVEISHGYKNCSTVSNTQGHQQTVNKTSVLAKKPQFWIPPTSTNLTISDNDVLIPLII